MQALIWLKKVIVMVRKLFMGWFEQSRLFILKAYRVRLKLRLICLGYSSTRSDEMKSIDLIHHCFLLCTKGTVLNFIANHVHYNK